MDLNNFETKLNTNNYTKDDIRELLNYTFKLKEVIECIKYQYETNFTEEELNQLQPRDECIYKYVSDAIK